MTVIEVSAYLGALVLACLAVFQLTLIVGVPLGRFAWGGAHDRLPARLRVGSMISILLYALFAAVLLSKAGSSSAVPAGRFLDITMWVCSSYFIIGVCMNAISRSKPERALMTPVALVLAVTFLIVAWS